MPESMVIAGHSHREAGSTVARDSVRSRETTLEAARSDGENGVGR
jgi:hypothetical protein